MTWPSVFNKYDQLRTKEYELNFKGTLTNVKQDHLEGLMKYCFDHMKNVEFPINPLEVTRLYRDYYQKHLRDNTNYKALPPGQLGGFYAKAVKDIFPILDELKHNKDIIDMDPVFLMRKRFKDAGSAFISTEEYVSLKRKCKGYLGKGPEGRNCDCELVFKFYKHEEEGKILCETCMHSFLKTNKEERKELAAQKKEEIDFDDLF